MKKNKVVVEDKIYSKKDGELIYNLESLIIQKPNRDYFFIPREWLYFKNKDVFESDVKKKGWVKNAERPVIHSDQNMFSTAEQMEKYLRFSKGYYNARVYPRAYLNDKKANVEYIITTEKGYTVRSKEYYSSDKRVMDIINQSEDQSLIKPGTPIDESVFDAEKTRISTIFLERGYANFGNTNVDFKADSSELQMDVFVTIVPPENDTIHRQYTIGQINIYPDYRGVISDSYSNVQTRDSIDYYITQDDFFVNPSTLDRAIKFREGSQFRKSNLDLTYTSLAKLGTFRFINISSTVSPLADTIIDYNILLTPINNPWSWEGSLNIFYSYFVKSDSRFGLGNNLSLNNVNAFGGGEKFRVGYEISAETILEKALFTNLSGKIETGLTYPVVKDPLGHIWVAKKLLPRNTFKNFKNKSTTDTELSYSYISTLEQYSLNSIKGVLQYEFSPENKIKWLYTTINVNSLSTNIDPIFQMEQLDNNKLLERSLDPVLITGFLLQEVEYRVDNPVFSNGFSWGTNIRAEQSGLEIAGLNSAYNALSGSASEWVIDLGQGKDFLFSKYILGDIDLRAKQIISGKHIIAGRIRGGVATPLNQNSVIPFIKQFYVGGGNSLRGWNARELGPGSYAETFLDPNIVTGFFQSGDIVMEANIEYRFPIYYLFEGAVFMDAGNVWTLREDPDRPGTQFLWDEFHNEIAVNYGIGIRINLDFIVLRFDFGQKLRYPFKHIDFDNKYWIMPELTTDYLRQANFAFGLNYPF